MMKKHCSKLIHHSRVLDACKVLEGTKSVSSCPCVAGGQWSHRGNSYSYCEEKNWSVSSTSNIALPST